MNAQPRPTADDTRARIIEAADGLFRRLGFAKTAVADIAAELGMSPANVYRFFSSKNAIVEAICQRCLGEIEAGAWAVVHSKASAAARNWWITPAKNWTDYSQPSAANGRPPAIWRSRSPTVW